MDFQLLQSIGLTESETKVYLGLLELGASSKGPIVDKSGVASSKIYELLEKLARKGLVSEVIKAGTKHFEAAPPARLLDYMREKEDELDRKKQELEKLLPELELKRSMAGIGSEAQIFKGMKGAATAFEDILSSLESGEELTALGISTFGDKTSFEQFLMKFHRRRAEKGIKFRIIVNENIRKFGESVRELPHTQVKFLPPELFSPVVFLTYKDKTLISIYLDELFIQITSKKLAEGLRNYTNYMWSIGKE